METSNQPSMPARLLPNAEIEMHPPEPLPEGVEVITAPAHKPVCVPISVSLTIDELVRDGMRLPHTDHAFRHMMAKLLALQKAITVELPGMLEACPPRNKARGTQEEIMSFCVSIGLPTSDGEWFFNKMMGCGWKNDGKKVVDWQFTCRAWKGKNYFPSQTPQHNGADQKPTPFSLKLQLDAIDERIRRIKRVATEGAFGTTLPENLRGEFKTLAAKRSEIVKKISSLT